jgi:PKD repeat protein
VNVYSVPSIPSVTVTEPDYCRGPGITVDWTYSHPQGLPQSAYQVQIDDTGSAWNEPFTVDSGKISSSGTSYFASGLAFNITYKARVRVWDSNDNVSDWKESSSWKTPKHSYPLVDFTWSPSEPAAKQQAQFTDLTTFYDTGGTGQRAWSWLFKAPSPSPSSALQNPAYTYDSAGFYQVQETVTDKDGYTCPSTKQINISLPIPVWKEVSPR